MLDFHLEAQNPRAAQALISKAFFEITFIMLFVSTFHEAPESEFRNNILKEL